MIINHNISALNTHRQLGANNNATSASLEKLSSGLQINRAGDDAAGLAISEKMRGQIRGLDMAAKNSQDGISLIQTAEGALGETHDILQRMRELATQASNDTNTPGDRAEIQKEVNELTSEINRIGNTTEFNTQGLLRGDGGVDLIETGLISSATSKGSSTPAHAKSSLEITTKAVADDTVSIFIGGEEFKHTFSTAEIAAADTVDGNAEVLRSAIDKFIDSNETLKGNFKTGGTSGTVTIEAEANKAFAGDKGAISKADLTGTIASTTNTAGVGTITHTAASEVIDFSTAFGTLKDEALTTAIKDLVGKGFEINGQNVEFYNQNDGTYKGDAVGVDISRVLDVSPETNPTLAKEALVNTIGSQIGESLDGVKIVSDGTNKLTVTTTATGADSQLDIKDGATKSDFTATFQVGANKGQSMTIAVGDMRAGALGLTGTAGTDGFSGSVNVTNGTDNNTVEAALDLSTHDSASKAIETINNAIEQVSGERSKLGAYQNRLEHTINNLGTSSENLTAAESRIRDVDYAEAA